MAANREHTYTDLPKASMPPPPEWATYVAGRFPQFKQHHTLGQVKNVLTNTGHGIVYRWMSRRGSADRNWVAVAVKNSDDGRDHVLHRKGFVPSEPVIWFKILEEEI